MAIHIDLESTWRTQLADEFEKPYFANLVTCVKQHYKTQRVYPPGKQIFRAFACCPFDQVKVVILGQDPYHGPGQAEGLCFSVAEGLPMPPSLVNIFKEQERDLGKPMPRHGSLLHWATQGVLLLNATLTVAARQAGSHQNIGWETFTDAAIKKLSDSRAQLVFMLWGAYAQRKGAVIDTTRHLVLDSPHPSPFSAHRGFMGNAHFSQANTYLQSHGKAPIAW